MNVNLKSVLPCPEISCSRHTGHGVVERVTGSACPDTFSGHFIENSTFSFPSSLISEVQEDSPTCSERVVAVNHLYCHHQPCWQNTALHDTHQMRSSLLLPSGWLLVVGFPGGVAFSTENSPFESNASGMLTINTELTRELKQHQSKHQIWVLMTEVERRYGV